MSKNLLDVNGKTLAQTAPTVNLNSWTKIAAFWGVNLFLIQKAGHIFGVDAMKKMFGWMFPDVVWEGIKWSYSVLLG